MKWSLDAVLAAMFVLGLGGRAKAADDKDAHAILDKAIKALGGQEKLSKIKAATWKIKGTITSNGNDSEYTSTLTAQGLDRFRATFETEYNGSKLEAITVLAKNKGWRKIGGRNIVDRKEEIDGSELADQKRTVYLEVVPTILVPLKGKDFKVAAAGEKRVGDKLAIGLKVTGPEGKDFTLFFDKDSGLPLMLTAKYVGSGGKAFTAETTFANYKEFAGIKKATKNVTKHNGEKFMEAQLTEFKVLDTVDPKTFEEPK